MNKMKGKGDVVVSLPRMPVRGSQNPNSEGTNTSDVNVGSTPLGVSSTIESSFVQDSSQSGGDQSGVSTYGQNDGVSSWLINETNVETLFGVKFTSQRDIEDYVSNFSPLVSPSTTINMPRELNSIDVAATFEVSLFIVGDLHKLINDIKAGKHDELLPGMMNDDRMETLDALGSICNSIQANRDNAYVIPCKVSESPN
ncbi:hypothetical protein Tco_0744771 [Tanacetum coccineum]